MNLFELQQLLRTFPNTLSDDRAHPGVKRHLDDELVKLAKPFLALGSNTSESISEFIAEWTEELPYFLGRFTQFGEADRDPEDDDAVAGARINELFHADIQALAAQRRYAEVVR